MKTQLVSVLQKAIIVMICALLMNVSDVLASSNPIPGVGIVVKRNPGSSSARTKTDKEGNFKFDKLEPGVYTIEVLSDDLTKSLAKLESKQPARAGHAMATTSSDKRTLTESSATGEGSPTLSPEISISLDAEAMASGAISKIDRFSWSQVAGPMTVTVGRDGVIEGQLRAGISTSRSNLRTK